MLFVYCDTISPCSEVCGEIPSFFLFSQYSGNDNKGKPLKVVRENNFKDQMLQKLIFRLNERKNLIVPVLQIQAISFLPPSLKKDA